MTEIEVLERCISALDNIFIPVAFTKQISIPIAQVSDTLRNLHDNMIRKEKEKKQNDKDDDDIEIGEPVITDKLPEDAEPIN